MTFGNSTRPYNVMEMEILSRFPSLNDWLLDKINFSNLNIYTDGSKTSEVSGCEVYCDQLNIEISQRLRTECNIFQAEV